MLSSLSCKLEPTARVSSADPREPTDLAQQLCALKKPGKSCTPAGSAALLWAAQPLPQLAWALASRADPQELGRLFHTAVV